MYIMYNVYGCWMLIFASFCKFVLVWWDFQSESRWKCASVTFLICANRDHCVKRCLINVNYGDVDNDNK